MNIITDLVNQLTDNHVSITSALLRLKVLASRLENKNLYTWVNKELSGYEGSDELPPYRVYACSFICNYINGNWKGTNQSLPISGLPDNISELLENIEFYEGVAVLESYLKDEKVRTITRPVFPEVLKIISEIYRANGNRFFNVHSGFLQVGKGAVEQAISGIRNTTLDLLLNLEQEFGFEIQIDELIKNKDDVNSVIYNFMSHTIQTSGDGNIINTGEKSIIKNKIIINKNSFDCLRKYLQDNFVNSEDIDELENLIQEQPDTERKLFGPKVNNWIKKMMNKSLNGSWQVGIGTAGTLLAEAIKGYYGL